MKLLRALVVLVVMATACAQSPVIEEVDPDASSTSAAEPADQEPAWTETKGSAPPARRDHSLVSSNDLGSVYLFGGRAGNSPLADLWVFEVASGTWAKIDAVGPSARFGHNAAFLEGKLVVFGGQTGPNSFVNDLWRFDPSTSSWARATPTGGPPAPRYGAGGAVVDGKLQISHGFTNQGRFDDTWNQVGEMWENASASETRPEKRCLLRTAHQPGSDKVVLFGGQSNSSAFLGDTWLYDPAARTWSELEAEGPSARNLYAMGTVDGTVYLFSGQTSEGPTDDLWTFDGASWAEVAVTGRTPPARSGADLAVLDGALIVFGGQGTAGDLSDTWVLQL